MAGGVLLALVIAFSHGDAIRVVNAMRPELRRCAEDTSSFGRMKVDAVVAPNGRVRSAKPRDVEGFSPKAQKCMLAVIRAQQFEPFEEREGDVHMTIPVIVKAPAP